MYLSINRDTAIICGESHSRFGGTRNLLGWFDAEHQASEAERGREMLRISLLYGHLDNSLNSLFLNRKIPFHAEPEHREVGNIAERQ